MLGACSRLASQSHRPTSMATGDRRRLPSSAHSQTLRSPGWCSSRSTPVLGDSSSSSQSAGRYSLLFSDFRSPYSRLVDGRTPIQMARRQDKPRNEGKLASTRLESSLQESTVTRRTSHSRHRSKHRAKQQQTVHSCLLTFQGGGVAQTTPRYRRTNRRSRAMTATPSPAMPAPSPRM